MSELVMTLDTDWAPDSAIDFTAGILVEHRVKATWFVTHASPAISRLSDFPELFEIGIHPNFLFEGRNDQGSSPAEVLDFCMNLVPAATSMRTHALVQSTPLFDLVLERTAIRTDVSLLLPRAPGLRAVCFEWKGKTLTRIPYLWEDDVEMWRSEPDWRLSSILGLGEGLKVVDFHPIHVFLNSADMAPYQGLKAETSIDEATPDQLQRHVHAGPGTRTMFLELCAHMAPAGRSSFIREHQLSSGA
jgi:hypothetical protein